MPFNMKRSHIIGSLLFVAAIAAIGAYTRSEPTSANKSSPPRDLTATSGPQRPDHDHATAASLQAMESSARPEPTSLSKDQRIAEYRFLSMCAKYKRMSTGIRMIKDDPLSWFNNEEARSSLSPEQLQGVEKTVAFVDDNAERCGPTSADDMATSVDLYRAALSAGYAGDLHAARCYVLAPWPASVGDGAPLPQLRNEYVANVEHMIEVGLKGGDWGMVKVLIGAYGALNHGLQAVGLPNDPAKAYGYQRLERLGTRGDMVKQADQALAMFAERISPRETVQQEKWAAETYATHFSQHPVAHDRADCDW